MFAPNKIGKQMIVFHDPARTGDIIAQSSTLTNAQIMQNLNRPGVSTRSEGQSIALSFIVWFKENDTLPSPNTDRGLIGDPADYQAVQIALEQPHYLTGVVSSDILTPGAPSHFYIGQTPPGIVNYPKPILFAESAGTMLYTYRAESKNSDRPDLIFTLTFNNLDMDNAVTTQKYVCSSGFLNYRTSTSSPRTTLISPMSEYDCFYLNPAQNKVSVETGDVQATNIRSGTAAQGDSTVVFSGSSNHLVVNGRNWTSCGAFGRYLATLGCGTTTIIPDATLAARLQTQYQKAAEAAKRVAIIGQTGSSATADTFLRRAQSAWLKPRGEVMYVDGAVDLNAMTVQGKKLLIARDNINVNGDLQSLPGAMTALVSLTGDVVIRGNQFQAAALALGGSGSDILIPGSGTLEVRGLLAGHQLNFTGRTAPGADTIASLTYDARFQRGELMGLGAILRPLVTEGSF